MRIAISFIHGGDTAASRELVKFIESIPTDGDQVSHNSTCDRGNAVERRSSLQYGEPMRQVSALGVGGLGAWAVRKSECRLSV